MFRSAVTITEKVSILVSLCLLFSGVYAIHPSHTTESSLLDNYNPGKRELFRKLVNDLFGTGDIEVFNDWMLVRTVEGLVREMEELLESRSHPELMDKATSMSDISLQAKPSAVMQAANTAKKWYRKASSLILVLFPQGKTERPVGTFDILDLYDPPALHTTIAVSGWLSENDDMKVEWNHLWKYPNQSRVLSVIWEAGNLKKTVHKALFHALSFVIPAIGFLNLLRNHPFRDASFRADAAGKQLAAYICSRAFGKGPISLLGFSLGTRVIFSCLEELARDDQVYVHDVILLGGAAPADANPWRDRRRAIAGRLVNVYSEKDQVLSIVYRVAKLHRPIGNGPIELPGLVENFDASHYVARHQDHRKFLDRTLALIKYQP